MNSAKLSIALTDNEFDRLGAFLERFPEAMNLEAMDGFFSALICAPEVVPMGEVMSQVWGEEAEFAGEDEARDIMTLIMRHWNTISRALEEDDLYFPYLLADEAGKARGNDWALGFYRGMKFSGRGWSELLNDESNGSWIPIFALAHEHDPDPEMNPGAMDDERRQTIIAGMIAGLKRIHQYFAPHRRAMAQDLSTTYRRNTPKVGRNDPCRCGSGRKYKQCCAGKDHTVN